MKKVSCLIVFALSGAMILSSCQKNNNEEQKETPKEYKLTFHQTEPGDIEDYVFAVIPGKTIQSDAWDVEPEINPKTGYTSEWDEYSVEEMTADLTVSPIYTPIEYTATFVNRVSGETMGTAKFTVESESLETPALPTETGYTYAWESYTIGPNNMTVYCDKTANMHSIKFYADEQKTQLVGQETFTIESDSVNEPAVPEKQGFDGYWPEYDLHVDQDIDVVAVYEVHRYYVQFRVNGENYGGLVGYELGDSWGSIEKPNVEITGYTVTWPDDVSLALAERNDPQIINAIVTANTYEVSYEGTSETTEVTYNEAYTLLSAGGIYSWVYNDEEFAESGEHWTIASDVSLTRKVTINTRIVDFEDGENKIVSIFDNFESLEVVDGEGLDGSKALKASYTGDTYKDCHLSFNKDYLDLVFADPNIKALSFYAKGTIVTNNFRHIQVDKQYVNGNDKIISCYEINSNGYGITNDYKQFFLTRGVYSQMSASDWSIQYGIGAAADLYLDNFQVSTHDYYEYNQNSLERGYLDKNDYRTYYLRDSVSAQADIIITTGSANSPLSLDYDMYSDGHRSIKVEKASGDTICFYLRGDYQYNNLPEEGILFDFHTTVTFNGWWQDQETGAISDGYDKHFVPEVNYGIKDGYWHTIHLTKDHINSDGGRFLNLKGSPSGAIHIDNIRLANSLSESFESAKAFHIGEYGYATGFDLANEVDGANCRDRAGNFMFLSGWDRCTSIEITKEMASLESQSLKLVKASGGTFQISRMWVDLMDEDSTITFEVYSDDSERFSFTCSGESEREVSLTKGEWNTVTLTKADFEENSSRFTQNAFGAGTYYFDNMQLHL